MAEDCLYLSIWSPASPAEQLRSVMVLLTSGKEEGDLSGVEMAATGDVVFVKVESRHGALGFLASQESLVTTNIGLLDQTLALKWIQGNIDLFGGDSGRVTILGKTETHLTERLDSNIPGQAPALEETWPPCTSCRPPPALSSTT